MSKKEGFLKQFFGPVESELEQKETKAETKEVEDENKTRIINFGEKKLSFKNKDKNKGVYSNEVIFFKPENILDCTKLGDWIFSEKIIVLDFEGIDLKLSQRIIDFVSGALYVTGATMVEMGKHVQCCVPNNYVAIIDIPGYQSGNEIFLGENEYRKNEVEEIKPKYKEIKK